MCVVFNGLVSKMQYLFGCIGLLCYFIDCLYSGYDIQCWKFDLVLMFYVVEVMQVKVENCILVDDFSVGVQLGIVVGMEVFYFCVDLYNQLIDYFKVMIFIDLVELLVLWQVCGWDIMC